MSLLYGHAHEVFGNWGSRLAYESQKGYVYEQNCFRYEYREQYIPGNSVFPGHVISYKDKVSIPCNSHQYALNQYRFNKELLTSHVKDKSTPKCTVSTTIGGLVGGGIAATLSKSDAYGWSIPLGAVLGAGIGSRECK